MITETTAGAILAGGRARRFGGRDKARLVVDGRTIIERQIQVLRAITSDVFVVGHGPDRFADLGLPVVADRISGAGTLGGILTALESTSAARVIVLACDMPFLVPDLLRALVGRAGAGDGAWVRTTRGPEPLVACYRQSARGVLRECIDAGRLKAADIGQRLRLQELSEEEVSAFGPPALLLANLNTPEDYARVQ